MRRKQLGKITKGWIAEDITEFYLIMWYNVALILSGLTSILTLSFYRVPFHLWAAMALARYRQRRFIENE